MNPRLGIACLLACAVTALIAAGCGKGTSTPALPTPSPSPSGSPAPDTLYVQSTKFIRVYKGASADSNATFATEVLPTNDITNPQIVYNPVSDTLWYPSAYSCQISCGNQGDPIETWYAASTKNGKAPDAIVPFQNGHGAAAFDPNHHLLFVANVFNPTVQVYTNPETMTVSATPAATVTMQIVDGGSGATPQPQEMYYDSVNDRMFVSDDVTTVAVFDNFGSTVSNDITMGTTTPTIAANRYIQGLQSPDGLAYSPKTDTLFVGDEHNKAVINVAGASILNGPVSHPPTITGFNLPGDLAFDEVHGFILFVYDGSQIDVIPNALVANGSLGTLAGVKVIFDAQTQLSGFGMALDTTH
jgi:hypothetical protein